MRNPISFKSSVSAVCHKEVKEEKVGLEGRLMGSKWGGTGCVSESEEIGLGTYILLGQGGSPSSCRLHYRASLEGKYMYC